MYKKKQIGARRWIIYLARPRPAHYADPGAAPDIDGDAAKDEWQVGPVLEGHPLHPDAARLKRKQVEETQRCGTMLRM